MSLEVLNTTASLLTVAIVAATALAALVQLRHLRAGNQTQALLSVSERLDAREFRDALTVANQGLEAALADSTFREYITAITRRVQPPEASRRSVEMHNAVVKVANTLEVLGVLVKNRVVEPGLFVDAYCSVAFGAWQRLASYTAFVRDLEGDDAIWEHFEYLAALSEDWIARHPSSYPAGVRRLKLRNPWPSPTSPSRRPSASPSLDARDD